MDTWNGNGMIHCFLLRFSNCRIICALWNYESWKKKNILLIFTELKQILKSIEIDILWTLQMEMGWYTVFSWGFQIVGLLVHFEIMNHEKKTKHTTDLHRIEAEGGKCRKIHDSRDLTECFVTNNDLAWNFIVAEFHHVCKYGNGSFKTLHTISNFDYRRRYTVFQCYFSLNH